MAVALGSLVPILFVGSPGHLTGQFHLLTLGRADATKSALLYAHFSSWPRRIYHAPSKPQAEECSFNVHVATSPIHVTQFTLHSSHYGAAAPVLLHSALLTVRFLQVRMRIYR